MSDALKVLLLLSLWCCLHPFACVLPLSIAAGAGIGHALGVWRARR